jgi:hypothetical protein
VKPLYDERNKLNKELDALAAKRKVLKDAFKVQQDEWYAFQREEKVRKDEEYRKIREEENRERKLKTIERAKERALAPAFELEISDCNVLMQFLNQLLGNDTQEATDAIENTKPSFDIRKISEETVTLPKGVSGAAVLKKKSDRLDEELYYSVGKNKKKAAPVTKPRETLKFDLSVLEQFFKLKIDVLTKFADLPAAVDAIKAKKANYLETQERATKENIAKAMAMEEKFLKSGEVDELVEDVVVESSESVAVEASA